jgi:3-dehydroquinate synthase
MDKIEEIEVSGYSLFLGDMKHSLAQLLSQYAGAQLFILTDSNTLHLAWPLIQSCFQDRLYTLATIPAGEPHKNLKSCELVWAQMTDAKLDRHALMINLGGGMIGDLGGFCASTYKRGIDFVQIPTTLLSQVDASIGGKLGIDFRDFKNHIGVFQFPRAVLIDPIFFDTLPYKELRSGYAEVIKHTLIADGDLWPTISNLQTLDGVDWAGILRKSLEVKRKIVLEDPYEKSRRKLLNFGHTIGHAIESQYLQSDSPLLHGEAIAAGMIYESLLSVQILGLDQTSCQSIIRYIESIYGPPPPLDLAATIPIMRQDKKNQAGKISFSLLESIGQSKWDILIDESELANYNFIY